MRLREFAGLNVELDPKSRCTVAPVQWSAISLESSCGIGCLHVVQLKVIARVLEISSLLDGFLRSDKEWLQQHEAQTQTNHRHGAKNKTFLE